MKIYESAENYLEAILVLTQQKGVVRSIDVAQYLEFSKPSVSRAVSLLRENGYVMMDHDGLLTLTASGQTIAARIYERHTLFTKWLIQLGVNAEVAAEDACRIEHQISEESFEKIKSYIQNNHRITEQLTSEEEK